jgi:hypothetical protein
VKRLNRPAAVRNEVLECVQPTYPQGLRFRRNPAAYLQQLEEEFLTSSLPV